MDIIKSIEHEQMKNKIPALKVGDTVKVHVRVKEGNRERIQVFEGTIIKIQGGGVNQTFTVRRISYGVGVEKTFLIHSPAVEKVEVVRVGKARRARLFYLRDRIGKSAKTKEQVGARIETLETVIKEEAGETVAEEAPVEENVSADVEQPVEEVAEVAEEKAEAPVEEKIEAPAEAPVESAPEEAPAVETAEVTTEEVVDTVSEETAEKVTDTPTEE